MNGRSHFARARALLTIAVLVTVSASCQHDKKDVGLTNRDEVPGETPGPAVENTTWQLASVGGRQAEPVPADARAAHLRLSSSDHRASGFSGVNSFNGTYTLAGRSLRFGPMAMTRRAGSEPMNQQEAALTRAITDTASWRTEGDRLELLGSDGKPLATFTRTAERESP